MRTDTKQVNERHFLPWLLPSRPPAQDWHLIPESWQLHSSSPSQDTQNLYWMEYQRVYSQVCMDAATFLSLHLDFEICALFLPCSTGSLTLPSLLAISKIQSQFPTWSHMFYRLLICHALFLFLNFYISLAFVAQEISFDSLILCVTFCLPLDLIDYIPKHRELLILSKPQNKLKTGDCS